MALTVNETSTSFPLACPSRVSLKSRTKKDDQLYKTADWVGQNEAGIDLNDVFLDGGQNFRSPNVPGSLLFGAL